MTKKVQPFKQPMAMPNQGPITIDKLYSLTYANAHEMIIKLKAEQKLALASEIEERALPPLYAQAQKYGDVFVPKMFDDYVAPDHFVTIMNKVKHWEQLLEWLYEFQFDIPMDMEV